MSGWFRAICCWMWLWGAAWTAGCVPTAQPPAPPSTQIPLSAFGNVAGNWAGIMTMTPRSGNDDWITVTINEDGTYRFESVRTIGIMQGQGKFALVDGKLRVEGERGWATGTLYEEGDRRLLKIQGADRDGVRYAADLAPAR